MKSVVIASEDDRGLDGVVSAHFGRCPHYTVVELDGHQVVSSRTVPNPHLGQHKPGQMPRFIQSLGADVILAGGMGPMAVQMFEGFGIEVATGISGLVQGAVDAYLQGRLSGIVPCNHDHPESCGGHGDGQGPRAASGGAAGPAPADLPPRLAIPVTSAAGLDATMDERFGRAPYFAVVDVPSGELVETVTNVHAGAAGGVGPNAVALVARSGAGGIIAGELGPKAVTALKSFGLTQWSASGELTVRQALARLMAGELSKAE